MDEIQEVEERLNRLEQREQEALNLLARKMAVLDFLDLFEEWENE